MESTVYSLQFTVQEKRKAHHRGNRGAAEVTEMTGKGRIILTTVSTEFTEKRGETQERPASEGRALERKEKPKTQVQNRFLGRPASGSIKERFIAQKPCDAKPYLDYAARRAIMQRGRESRAAPLGMTIMGRRGGGALGRTQEHSQE
jgi:hypothetical protein